MIYKKSDHFFKIGRSEYSVLFLNDLCIYFYTKAINWKKLIGRFEMVHVFKQFTGNYLIIQKFDSLIEQSCNENTLKVIYRWFFN